MMSCHEHNDLQSLSHFSRCRNCSGWSGEKRTNMPKWKMLPTVPLLSFPITSQQSSSDVWANTSSGVYSFSFSSAIFGYPKVLVAYYNANFVAKARYPCLVMDTAVMKPTATFLFGCGFVTPIKRGAQHWQWKFWTGDGTGGCVRTDSSKVPR